MNKYPNKEVENKIKEVEEFAKKNNLGYLYIYSSDEDIDGDVMYSTYDEYLISFAYKLQSNELAYIDEYIVYINGDRFMSRGF